MLAKPSELDPLRWPKRAQGAQEDADKDARNQRGGHNLELICVRDRVGHLSEGASMCVFPCRCGVMLGLWFWGHSCQPHHATSIGPIGRKTDVPRIGSFGSHDVWFLLVSLIHPNHGVSFRCRRQMSHLGDHAFGRFAHMKLTGVQQGSAPTATSLILSYDHLFPAV